MATNTTIELPGGSSYNIWDLAVANASELSEQADANEAAQWLAGEAAGEIMGEDIDFGLKPSLHAAVRSAAQAAIAQLLDRGEIVVSEGWDVR